MPFLSRFFFLILACVPLMVGAADPNIDLRGTEPTITETEHSALSDFAGPLMNFFFGTSSGGNPVQNVFVTIANNIKIFFTCVAVIFLLIGVLKLLFGHGTDEDAKKWRNNIIWVSVGIFVMNIAFSVWKTLYLTDLGTTVNGGVGWKIWINVFNPIVNLLLMLASFGFLSMGIYAFYIIITGAGDEEKLKKGKNIVIYALVGFLLIRIPRVIIPMIYGSPQGTCDSTFSAACQIGQKSLRGSVEIIGRLIVYLNGFLMLLSVILVIYAGWLVFISGGDEEKLKKAKSIVLYIFIGFFVLVGSNLLFQFFMLRGA